jgi:hypothetical protein
MLAADANAGRHGVLSSRVVVKLVQLPASAIVVEGDSCRRGYLLKPDDAPRMEWKQVEVKRVTG